MSEMADGSLWLATRGGIVGASDPRSGRFRTAAVLPGGGPLTAIGSWDARVLVGTTRGLAVLDAPPGRVGALGEAFRAHHLDALTIAAIRSARGVAWIAAGTDLFRAARDGDSGRVSVDRLDIPIEGSVSALSTAASGRLWIGSDRGEIARAEWSGPGAAVAMRSLDAVSPSDRDAIAAHGVVSALHEDPQGRLWVGTRRGLGRIDLSSGSVSWLGQGDGLPSTTIAGIEADDGAACGSGTTAASPGWSPPAAR